MNLAELLERHLPAFYRTYGDRCTPSMQQAIHAIQRCHTDSCGHSRWQCTHCDLQEEHPLSCGHRSCPRCQHQTTRQWLARQQTKLLPVDYFMVTLTLPCQLRSLAWCHQAQVYRAMFRVANGLLKDFAARSPRMGDDIGFTAVLHTHSRTLDYHPHLHLVVPGGSYDPRRRHWRKIRQRYLFNARALARVWRARLLAALRDEAGLVLPSALPEQWVVDCRRVGRGLPALQYLSRYLYRGVLPERNILGENAGLVTFRYRDSQSGQLSTRTLPAVQFLWLVLQHVLPKGFHRLRDYGFLRGNAQLRLQRIQLLLQVTPTPPDDTPPPRPLCPCCHLPMLWAGVRAARPPTLG
ncbi:IS91 family transposase [Marinobacterium sedimentorum]|uniref:IS91 family transposase n=1 Tax=Marinobacterium sedimentorum TaxID=2927804 RepID=UPI0020C6F054|nr:transposase [Marinobacterium sedimentorum]MCP8686414.1 transposase [Marinobacterium sedimentorum]